MQQSNERMLTVGVVLAGALLASSALGEGKAKPAKKAVAAVAALSPETLAHLKSEDPMELRSGLDDARMAGKDAAAAVPQIAALLRAGLPYGIAEAAIDTLGDIGAPDGVAAIAPYARHREPRVRRAAIRALTKTTDPAGVAVAATTLRAGLSDPDPQVRALSATGLGSLRATAAVRDLFLALDHKIYEAAVSLGQLCQGAECDTLLGKVGKIPFDVVTTGLDQVLFRPASEVSDDQKLAVVTRVRDLGTRDANLFLKQVQGRWPKTGSVKVKREIDNAVLATLSSPGGGS